MPPKFRFTREEIVAAALAVTRRSGISGLTARSLAAELGCSVKPIFGLFKSMEAFDSLFASVRRASVSRQNKRCFAPVIRPFP